MKVNSTTFSFKRGAHTYTSLEDNVVLLAHEANLSNVCNVQIHTSLHTNTLNCSFKIADINAPVLPGTDNQQQPVEELSQSAAAQIKSDAILKYLEENQIQLNSEEDIKNLIDTISQVPLTPVQLSTPTTNANPDTLAQIAQALNNNSANTNNNAM